MNASNSMDKDKSMDNSKSMVTINSKDTGKPGGVSVPRNEIKKIF